MAAPAAAMAEATLYGKLHVSIDYAEVDNAIAPEVFDIGLPSPTSGRWEFVEGSDDLLTVEQDGETYFISLDAAEVAASEGLDFSDVVVVDENGIPIAGVKGEDFKGWGINGDGWRRYTGGLAADGLTRIPQAQSRSNRVGIKGSEDLGNGLKAIYQVEFGVNLSDTNNNVASNSDAITYRNTFVGLAGDWGTFLVGRHDTPLKISTGKLDLFSDTMADYNGTVGFDDNRTDNTVAYISPSFSGFSLALAAVSPGGTYFGGENINADGFGEAYSLAAIYNNGPFYASAAYESISKEMYMDFDVSKAGKAGCFTSDGLPLLNCDYVPDDYTKWRLGLGLLDWNGFTLTAIYEQQDKLPTGDVRVGVATVGPDGTVRVSSQGGVKEQRLWQVQAAYAFGNNQIKAMYGAVDRDADRPFSNTRDTLAINKIRDDLKGDREAWAIGFDHNFSKRTKAYALYTEVTDDQDGLPGIGGAQWSGFSLGMIHAF
jgi:predicted porin